MRGLWSGLLLASSLLSAVSADETATPFLMNWAGRSYGPDGPWQAVNVSIGTPKQPVSLYPGGIWGSHILTPYICQNKSLSPTCYAQQAGLFNPDNSSTFNNHSIALYETGQITTGIHAIPEYGFMKNSMDNMDIGGVIIPNVTILTVMNISQTYPGGRSYPVEVGILSLGAPRYNTSYTESDGRPPLNTTFINSYLYTNGGGKAIPSYSYGLHIGSAALNIPGSLLLGGYDQSRALAPVSAQPYTSAEPGGSFVIELLDIGIGVATGGSPWNFTNKTGLLIQGDSSPSSPQTLPVTVSPVDPYLYLPKSTCDAIAAELPVEYHADMGLYYWNTTSPEYSKIVTSPAYLGFTFQLNTLNTANFTVKVPFALLNLTLEAPLVSTPTQYFPCFTSNGTYGLGRAFLQAAFVGANWSNGGVGNWFLAQAPGPNYQAIPSTTVIAPGDQSLTGSQNSWLDTWTAHWTPLPEPSGVSNAADSSASGSSGGLSSGAKAGIGIGASIGGLLIIAGILLCLLRRGRPEDTSKAEATPLQASPAMVAPAAVMESYKPYKDMGPSKQTYAYYGGPPPVVPGSVPRAPVELDNHSGRIHELQS